MLALDLAHDTADNAGTDFRILGQLGSMRCSRSDAPKLALLRSST
jgi:hypothetical protein